MIRTKTLFHRLVAALLVFTATISSALAADSGTGWSYNSASNTLTLSGSEVDWTAIKDFSSTTEHVLFADDYAVSSIPEEAFRAFSKLTAVEIPSVVTYIWSNAFCNCKALASVTLSEGLTSIGTEAFSFCSSLSSVSFPSSLTSIGSGAFSMCTSLSSVSIQEGLTSIDDFAFNCCTPLSSVTLPASLTSIGDYAFNLCNNLMTVEILSNGTSDNKHFVYLGDGSDKNATGTDVFRRNKATLVYNPNTTWIGDDDTQNLRYYFNTFVLRGTGWSYDTATNILSLFGGEVDWNAIKEFKETTEQVVFAEDYAVSSIPSMAFFSFTKLKEIEIPDVVTSIGMHAFYYGISLTSVTIPSGLTSIGDYAFSGCETLTSVSLPEGLTSLGMFAFQACTSLTSVSIPESLTSIDLYTFTGCSALSSVSLPEGVTSIGGGAFKDCSSLTSITLPASLTSIGYEAFLGCSSLNTVEMLSNGTSDNKHFIYLGGYDDKTAAGTDVFPRDQAALIYDPYTTWIGDSETENLRYYFNASYIPTSIKPNVITPSTSRYYDLGGRPVSPESHKGVAVKLQDGKASLTTTK